jgi:hypothetical protein
MLYQCRRTASQAQNNLYPGVTYRYALAATRRPVVAVGALLAGRAILGRLAAGSHLRRSKHNARESAREGVGDESVDSGVGGQITDADSWGCDCSGYEGQCSGEKGDEHCGGCQWFSVKLTQCVRGCRVLNEVALSWKPRNNSQPG